MTTGDVTFDILKLASIRSFVDQNMPEGMYFDVFEIKLPSQDGDYKNFDAVIPVDSIENKNKLIALFANVENANVAIVLM